MTTILLKNGTIVSSTGTVEADILIEDEKIKTIGPSLDVKAEKTIDAEGRLLLPGGIDPHVHMELPLADTVSSDTFETGSIAALHGGTTTIIDFAMQEHGKSLKEALAKALRLSEGKTACDFSFHLGVTDLSTSALKEVQSAIEKWGISSFKVFTAYPSIKLEDEDISALMGETEKHGGLICLHAENGEYIEMMISKNKAAGNLGPKFHAESRPALAEGEATGRVIDLAYNERGGAPLYIMHLTCEESFHMARQAILREQCVYVETCPQYLFLDDSYYEPGGIQGAKYVLSPPLREMSDISTLWSGLADDNIHTIATDHCPFTLSQKSLGLEDFTKIPNGLPGVEYRLELLYWAGVDRGRIPIEKFVDLTSTKAAKLFGLYPQKGVIAEGSDADIVIFDPTIEHTISVKTHNMNVDYSPYEGLPVKGKCVATILRGKVAVLNGVFMSDKNFGKFLKRKPFEKV